MKRKEKKKKRKKALEEEGQKEESKGKKWKEGLGYRGEEKRWTVGIGIGMGNGVRGSKCGEARGNQWKAALMCEVEDAQKGQVRDGGERE